MRIATWNVCWFAELFDREDRLVRDDGPSGVAGVTRAAQADAIGRVLRAVDADLFVLTEAPNTGRRQNTSRALIRFAETYDLRQSHALIGFESPTHQEIAALWDPAALTLRHDPKGGTAGPAPRFDGTVEAEGEAHVFSKPPLELEVLTAEGALLRVIGVHAKSKRSHDHDPEGLASRRRHIAQCVWLRARVEAHLAAGEDLIVLGDLNDGPGLDPAERRLGRSGLEIVLGDPACPERELVEPYSRAWREGGRGGNAATARFYDGREARFVNTLIDFVMLSPGLAARTRPRWRIWHPFDDPACFADAEMQAALLAASDHFPVSVDLALAPGPP